MRDLFAETETIAQRAVRWKATQTVENHIPAKRCEEWWPSARGGTICCLATITDTERAERRQRVLNSWAEYLGEEKGDKPPSSADERMGATVELVGGQGIAGTKGSHDPFTGIRGIANQGIDPQSEDEGIDSDPFSGELKLSAAEWLTHYLSSPAPSVRVFAEAEAAGYSRMQMKRAKALLRIKSSKVGNRWYWIAP